MPPSGEDSTGKKSVLVQLAKYSQLAFIFPAATFAGWLIGTGLDRWLHTRPVFLAIFLLLGGAAGVRNIYRIFAPRD